MGLALFLRKQLCRYHYRCHSYRHRHAMYPTQQPDQYFRHLPVCLQSGKYDFHDHLLHRRLFGYLPCRKQLADLGMEWRGRHRRYFNNNIVVHHPLQQEITRILSFSKQTQRFDNFYHAKDKEDIEQNCYTFVASNYKRQIDNRFVNQA